MSLPLKNPWRGGVSYVKQRLRSTDWGLSPTEQASGFTLATAHIEILARAAAKAHAASGTRPYRETA